jgi:NAD(P)-dependent dehydrogenase (short-subunit alcohol dehydrogenase family)
MSGITIINGGTQGLGEATARALAGKGADGLVLVGRSVDRGTALAAELTNAGTRSIFVHADANDIDAPEAVVTAAKAAFGTVTGLVNVAAKTTRSTLWNDTPQHFQAMMQLNVQAPYFMIQATARLMIETHTKGSIVNVGSTSGYGGQTKLSAYSISKGALAIMTKNLAFALMRNNVRVNQVNPGWMDTESEHRTQVEGDGSPENWLELAEPNRPMGRLVQPWEVANAIVFCLSAESGLMTGNLIDMDQSVQGAGDPPIPSVAETPRLAP